MPVCSQSDSDHLLMTGQDPGFYGGVPVFFGEDALGADFPFFQFVEQNLGIGVAADHSEQIDPAAERYDVVGGIRRASRGERPSFLPRARERELREKSGPRCPQMYSSRIRSPTTNILACLNFLMMPGKFFKMSVLLFSLFRSPSPAFLQQNWKEEQDHIFSITLCARSGSMIS